MYRASYKIKSYRQRDTHPSEIEEYVYESGFTKASNIDYSHPNLIKVYWENSSEVLIIPIHLLAGEFAPVKDD